MKRVLIAIILIIAFGALYDYIEKAPQRQWMKQTR